MQPEKSLMPIERVERSILFIRGQRVMLDKDLAEIYQVETKVLNQAVKRNKEKFPPDFMFQLTREELTNLRSQFVTSSSEHGGRRFLPYAFTEHGAVMLANVLKSSVAIQASIQIVRAFIKLREILASHEELVHRLEELERKYDKKFAIVFEAIRQLMLPSKPKPRQIGFISEKPIKKS